MPSTRKQKAKERRSRQLILCLMYEMLISYSRKDGGNYQSDSELNLNPVSILSHRYSNVDKDDFRSLLTNCLDNSEITIETTRMISEEISSQ